MSKIKLIKSREILDSRGNPTLETTVILDDQTTGTASVPSGASLGKYEAVELRDKDPQRFGGMGVLKAIENVNNIIGPKLIGFEIDQQEKIDELMKEIDGTQDKRNLGANSILSVSLAVARAAANSSQTPLYLYLNMMFNKLLPTKIKKMPSPVFNIINGGKHGAGNLDFQEFHVIPATHLPYHKVLQMGEEIYQELKKVLIYRNAIHSVGDEGGFAPNLFTNLDALEIIIETIRSTRYSFAREVFLGLDIAASHFKKDGGYLIKDRAGVLSSSDFVDYLIDLNRQYHLVILEDPVEEDDWESWKRLTALLGKEILIVGDDLLATNPERVKIALEKNACNAILVKPNQIGTLTETLEVVKLAREGGFKIVMSHRSGETNDSFIADLAVGVNAEYVKFGAPVRGERVAKYNRLLEIESELFS